MSVRRWLVCEQWLEFHDATSFTDAYPISRPTKKKLERSLYVRTLAACVLLVEATFPLVRLLRVKAFGQRVIRSGPRGLAYFIIRLPTCLSAMVNLSVARRGKKKSAPPIVTFPARLFSWRPQCLLTRHAVCTVLSGRRLRRERIDQ